VLTARTGHLRLPVPSDFHVVFLVAAAMTFAGSLLALRIRDRDAAGTMLAPASVVEAFPTSVDEPAVEL
jgi:hypothetical protein